MQWTPASVAGVLADLPEAERSALAEAVARSQDVREEVARLTAQLGRPPQGSATDGAVRKRVNALAQELDALRDFVRAVVGRDASASPVSASPVCQEEVRVAPSFSKRYK